MQIKSARQRADLDASIEGPVNRKLRAILNFTSGMLLK